MPALYALTLFVSAALLFSVQPLLGKLLLPFLGGASSVWTTCMVFYQAVLLAGYLYAHVVANRLPQWLQVALQLALLTAALATLPFGLKASAIDALAAGAEPRGWLLRQLVGMAGLPFLVVSTTGPLLQRWFSQLGQPRSADPYFLYSASNLGSLLALAAYPVWLEIAFDVPEQSNHWRWAFMGLLLLVAACGWALLRTKTGRRETAVAVPDEAPVGWRRRGWWVLLACVPSSLLLGVTTYLTTDIASLPLLWVVPLGLYLLTFVLAFARRTWLPRRWVNGAVPVLAIGLIFMLLSRATEPVWLLVACHLLFFFLAALCCHQRLADDRPGPGRLTEFYLWLSVGGALGGLFNALAAPVLFRDVTEYPLMILVASALYQARPFLASAGAASGHQYATAVAVAALTAGLGWLALSLAWAPGMLTRALVFGVPAVLCFTFSRRPQVFALALAGVVLGGQVFLAGTRQTLFVDRSFFGVSRVTLSADGRFRQLDHGNTAHGRQFIAAERRCEPLAYYHRSGPLGTMMSVFNRQAARSRVALIGLGAGAALTYARTGQTWDVFEIDPLVIRLAGDGATFSFLTECSPVTPNIVEGDGRLQIARAVDGRYDLVILDAFSSDAIPTHLLTGEAIALYFSKLAPDGWLVLHVSNRYLDLEQVIAGTARAAGLTGLSWIDADDAPVDGKEDSHWLVLARTEQDLQGLLADPRRIPLESRPAVAPWTDARSSVLPLIRW